MALRVPVRPSRWRTSLSGYRSRRWLLLITKLWPDSCKGVTKRDLKKQHEDIIPWFKDNKEGFTLEFDEKNAVLTDISLFNPEDNNPFVEYSRRAMLQNSYRNVLGIDFGDRDDTKLRDFYSDIHNWTSVKNLKEIKQGEVKNVIYMLYDENSARRQDKYPRSVIYACNHC